MFVQIETTTLCNATCAFCVHKNMERPRMHMDKKVFEKTILDCKRIYPLEVICLTGLGETLLDPEIIDRIKLTRHYLKDVKIDIFTNGTNLKKYLPDLISLKVNLINLSLNAVNSEKRKSIMGIDGIFNDLDYIIANKGKVDFKLSSVADLGLMECGDAEELKGKYGDLNFIHLGGNWAGKLFPIKHKPVKACQRVFGVSHVLVDGRVALCCFDSEGDVILGNDLIEAFNSKKLKYYQETMLAGKRYELELCKDCTMI